ncbi:uncharacterized protein BCR38DRAFT_411012 [Pseudomassariella vexata]|uniref:DUF7730 domain-containing protein n=1 Tax=Pseudomassariella vexata TaxID=1141098 RepID=A0A1Y2DVE0_9PEZI|nr:uncharacterized protein BCR38DRAFT_411012 [Pseudomassariella vexata]ORY62615.1 hypothetical protein BCR38DRAFT_411012 [Pseudomassariella vexata]
MSKFPADEQFQSPLFKLPPEVRDLIYCRILLNGAKTQHIRVYYRYPAPGCLQRGPCSPIADEEFIKEQISSDTSSEELDSRLTDYARDPYRNGHFNCQQILKDDPRFQEYQLSSAVPLFLTCRKIYREAVPKLYSFRFNYFADALLFLRYARLAELDRIRNVECFMEIEYLADVDLRELCGRLANLTSLQRLHIVMDPGQKEDSNVLPVKWLDMLSLIKRPERYEVHVLGLEADESESYEPASEQRPFVLWRKREPAWIYGQAEILAKGVKAIPDVCKMYSQPVMKDD